MGCPTRRAFSTLSQSKTKTLVALGFLRGVVVHFLICALHESQNHSDGENEVHLLHAYDNAPVDSRLGRAHAALEERGPPSTMCDRQVAESRLEAGR